jgi:hypothetical protein
MNGIHLEAFVMGGAATVALHCEGGCPVRDRERCMEALAERIGPEVANWADAASDPKWVVLPRGVAGCSVCESQFRSDGDGDAAGTAERIARALRRLQTLAPLIDATIRELGDTR